MRAAAVQQLAEQLGYFDALCAAMNMLAEHDDVVFMGQGVGVPGTTMSQTLDQIAPHKRLEMPVAEDMQMGMAIGMSLQGLLPVCIYPRWNFLLLAANQLINHLDRLPLYSKYRPKVIIRTAIPSTRPFDPGPQHDDDFTNEFALMCNTVQFRRLDHTRDILRAYEAALNSDKSMVLVEWTDRYKNERGNAPAG